MFLISLKEWPWDEKIALRAWNRFLRLGFTFAP